MRTNVAAMLCGILAFMDAFAQDGGRYGGASAMEQVQLPKYCYYLHVDKRYQGHPEYDMPRVCGPYMNHYCEGLIQLMRAQKATSPLNERRANAGRARSGIEYTLKGMTKECPLRADAEAALVRAKSVQAGLR